MASDEERSSGVNGRYKYRANHTRVFAWLSAHKWLIMAESPSEIVLLAPTGLCWTFLMDKDGFLAGWHNNLHATVREEELVTTKLKEGL